MNRKAPRPVARLQPPPRYLHRRPIGQPSSGTPCDFLPFHLVEASSPPFSTIRTPRSGWSVNSRHGTVQHPQDYPTNSLNRSLSTRSLGLLALLSSQLRTLPAETWCVVAGALTATVRDFHLASQ